MGRLDKDGIGCDMNDLNSAECVRRAGRSFRLLGAFAVAGLALALGLHSVEAAARKAHQAAAGAPAAGTVYADERDCSDKGALDADECHNAALNSRAEYEEKAPRFEASDACARVFGAHNCAMRIGGGTKGIGFLPSYRGFTLIRGKGEEMLVLPSLASASRAVEFTPRTVSRLDADQDPARAARAQAAWQRSHAPVIRSAAGGVRYRDVPKGAVPDLSNDAAQPGPAASIPVKPSMLKTMQDEMRKYGSPPPK